jgi:hypothetical protein
VDRQALLDAITMILKTFDVQKPSLAEALVNAAIAWSRLESKGDNS